MWPNRSLVNCVVWWLEEKCYCEEACRTQSSEHCLWVCIDQRYNAGPSDPVSLYSEEIDRRLSDTTQNQDESSVIARSRRERGIEDETGSIASLEFRFFSVSRAYAGGDDGAVQNDLSRRTSPARSHAQGDDAQDAPQAFQTRTAFISRVAFCRSTS